MFHAVAGPTEPGRAGPRSFSGKIKFWLESQVPGNQAQLEIFPWARLLGIGRKTTSFGGPGQESEVFQQEKENPAEIVSDWKSIAV